MATENDIVLIYLENAPVSFARVESIVPDAKKDWFHIKLLMLQVPVQVVTWILKNEYINGAPFTMNGKTMRLETIKCPESDGPLPEKTPSSRKTADIISFADLKKHHEPDPG